MLGHKINLNRLEKTEIISSIFSDHNETRKQLQEKKKNLKKHKHMETE